jgi:hypothetical protein
LERVNEDGKTIRVEMEITMRLDSSPGQQVDGRRLRTAGPSAELVPIGICWIGRNRRDGLSHWIICIGQT